MSTFNFCMKAVNEFYVFLTGINGWGFFCKISGCGIDSCCSYLNFRYRGCFEQGAPWHSDNYRVYMHSKTRTWHDKKRQLKNLLPLYSVLLIYLFTAKLRHLRFSMVEQFQSRLARIRSKQFLFIRSEILSCLSYLCVSKNITRKIMLI